MEYALTLVQLQDGSWHGELDDRYGWIVTVLGVGPCPDPAKAVEAALADLGHQGEFELVDSGVGYCGDRPAATARIRGVFRREEVHL